MRALPIDAYAAPSRFIRKGDAAFFIGGGVVSCLAGFSLVPSRLDRDDGLRS